MVQLVYVSSPLFSPVRARKNQKTESSIVQVQIYQAASNASLLTLVEVMIILETLERSSIVVRKTKEMEEREEGERIEWDEARWFVTERGYKA